MLNQTITLVSFLLFFAFSCVQGEEVSPLDLVVSQRADVMAKYIYAKHRSWNTSCKFGQEIYYRHLQVWNNFWEDEPPKRCFQDYFNSFNKLLDSIETKGFDPLYPVPLGRKDVIHNGAHRLTACLLYNKMVTVHRCSNICDYGFEYFQKLGLESRYLDAMAMQYCELKPKSHVIVIFPSISGYEQEIEKIIERYAQIVFKKKAFFTANGGMNLILTLYDREPWMGNVENNYSGARSKAQSCFPKNTLKKQPVRIYLVESEHLDQIKKCKMEIRALFNHFQHCVHATDTHQEAIISARALFNKNSIHCLNYRKDLYFPQFENFFESYRKALEGHENEWFCVDGGAVLAAYGLRDCNDFDILHYEPEMPDLKHASVDSHNSHLFLHALPLDDILFDPDNHFYYRGIKFCSLNVIKKMKMNRKEPKDLKDIASINQVMAFERITQN